MRQAEAPDGAFMNVCARFHGSPTAVERLH